MMQWSISINAMRKGMNTHPCYFFLLPNILIKIPLAMFDRKENIQKEHLGKPLYHNYFIWPVSNSN